MHPNAYVYVHNKHESVYLYIDKNICQGSIRARRNLFLIFFFFRTQARVRLALSLRALFHSARGRKSRDCWKIAALLLLQGFFKVME